MQLTLAQAIRAGCLLAPEPLSGLWFVWDETRKAACTLRAALLGSGFDPQLIPDTSRYMPHLLERYPELNLIVAYPNNFSAWFACGQLSAVIFYLTDHAGWDRERIADWVESLGS